MGKHKKIVGGVGPEWTKEEMMAYLDWNAAEDTRVDRIVEQDFEVNSFRTRRRSLGQLWEEADRDLAEQNHSMT